MRYASLYQPENVWVVRFINKLVCRAYCDRIVKLSDSLQALLLPINKTERNHPPSATSSYCLVDLQGEGGGRHLVQSRAAAHILPGARAPLVYLRPQPRVGPGREAMRPQRRPPGAFSLPLTVLLQELPRSTSCNVHGVRAEFLALGRHAAEPEHAFTEGAYFIGKLLWAKGHGLLIDYLAGEEGVRVDLYGNGEDSAKVQAAAAEAAVDLRFFGGRDHSDESLHSYKVFVNPSQTEVLSTTTAEALAMGKFLGGTRCPRRATMVPLCGGGGERGEPTWPGCRPCGSQRRDCGTPLLGYPSASEPAVSASQVSSP